MHYMGEGKQTLVHVCLKHNSNPSQINLLFVIIRTAGWCVFMCARARVFVGWRVWAVLHYRQVYLH